LDCVRSVDKGRPTESAAREPAGVTRGSFSYKLCLCPHSSEKLSPATSSDVAGPSRAGPAAAWARSTWPRTRRLQIEVALKVLSPSLSMTTRPGERFIREAQLAAGSWHPNVSRSWTRPTNEATALLYPVMKYVAAARFRGICGTARCLRQSAGHLHRIAHAL